MKNKKKGRMRTVLSSNRLQNLFSRFSDNEKKKGFVLGIRIYFVSDSDFD